MYGGTGGLLLPPGAPEDGFVPSPKVAFSRRRLNDPAIALAVFLPWGLFSGTFWLLSAQVRYLHFSQCLFLVICGLAFTVALSAKAVLVRWQQRTSSNSLEPTWFAFLAASCIFAWLLAVLLGEYNYVVNRVPFNTMHDLNTVIGVDVSTSAGKSYMDASVMLFKEGTYVDQQRSIAYKNGDAYCVAPVTVGNMPLASYDFWAVGIGCCNPYGGSFFCGEALSKTANAGLRLMEDWQRPFYRIAVDMASEEYGIHATNPIFLHWAEDPATVDKQAHTAQHYEAGWTKVFWTAVILHALGQGFAVFVVVSHYSKYLM